MLIPKGIHRIFVWLIGAVVVWLAASFWWTLLGGDEKSLEHDQVHCDFRVSSSSGLAYAILVVKPGEVICLSPGDYILNDSCLILGESIADLRAVIGAHGD